MIQKTRIQKELAAKVSRTILNSALSFNVLHCSLASSLLINMLDHLSTSMRIVWDMASG